MNTYRMIYFPYVGWGSKGLTFRRFEAPNNRLALLKADPNYGLGCGYMDEDPDVHYLKRFLIALSWEEAIERVSIHNGDGTDMLMYLQNETTGEVLFKEGDLWLEEELEKWLDSWIPKNLL